MIIRLAKGSLRGVIGLIRQAQRKLHAREVFPVRRIERVYPPSGQRVVAMTFDDGPTASPPRPGSGESITLCLLDTMRRFEARGTFNVIGSTGENYPDKPGKPDTVLWSGIRYDHYPEFGQDHLAGAEAQPRLTDLLLEGGHEIANHSYRHVAFGPSRLVYGKRVFFPSSREALEDLERLHDLILTRHGYRMTLSRSPHYIDRTTDGKTSYHLYARMGYQYLAASFDGGGWLPSSGDYRKDVKAMVDPLRRALDQDPESLNGQIIFQKDGYNMSGESPVVDALPQQLDLLHRYGYRVVTVSQLLSLSPFTDVPTDSPYFSQLLSLCQAGASLGYRDNTFRPEKRLTWKDLLTMLGISISLWGLGEMPPLPLEKAGSRRMVTPPDLLQLARILETHSPSEGLLTRVREVLPPGEEPLLRRDSVGALLVLRPAVVDAQNQK